MTSRDRFWSAHDSLVRSLSGSCCSGGGIQRYCLKNTALILAKLVAISKLFEDSLCGSHDNKQGLSEELEL